MQIEKYKRRTSHNIADSTLNSRISAFNNFESHGYSGEVTVDKVEKWIDELIQEYEDEKISTGSIRQYYNAMRSYFKQVKGDPTALDHITSWLPKGKTDHGDYLTTEEWEKMINGIISYRDRTVILLMYEYARRPGEIRLLNMDDIVFSDKADDNEGTITFNILKKRRDPDEDVFRATFKLKENCERALKEYIEYARDEYEDEDGNRPLFTTSHGRISYDSIWIFVKKYAKDIAPDKNITPKSMRHSRATHLDWDSDYSPEQIARDQLIHEPGTDVISAYIHDRSESQVRDVLDTKEDEDE